MRYGVSIFFFAVAVYMFAGSYWHHRNPQYNYAHTLREFLLGMFLWPWFGKTGHPS